MPKREDERYANLRTSTRWCSKHQCLYNDPADCPYRRGRGRDIFADVVWPDGTRGSSGLFDNVIWPDADGNYPSR